VTDTPPSNLRKHVALATQQFPPHTVSRKRTLRARRITQIYSNSDGCNTAAAHGRKITDSVGVHSPSGSVSEHTTSRHTVAGLIGPHNPYFLGQPEIAGNLK